MLWRCAKRLGLTGASNANRTVEKQTKLDTLKKGDSDFDHTNSCFQVRVLESMNFVLKREDILPSLGGEDDI